MVARQYRYYSCNIEAPYLRCRGLSLSGGTSPVDVDLQDLVNKTQNITATAGDTTFTGVVRATNFVGSTTNNTTLGYVIASRIKQTLSTAASLSLGGSSVVDGSNLGTSTTSGSYQRFFGWDAVGTLHAVTPTQYLGHLYNDNACGTIKCFVANKLTTNAKQAVVTIDFLKVYGSNVAISVTSLTKTANLTTLTVGTSTNSITLNTDADCKFCFMVMAGI